MVKVEPKQVDNWIYAQLLIVFLCSYLINVYTNGQATIIFLEEEYSDTSLTYQYINENNKRIIDEYKKEVTWKSNTAKKVAQYLYFVGSPLASILLLRSSIINIIKKRRLKKERVILRCLV